MASVVMTLTLEPELIEDSVRDLEVIFRNLASRHGDCFRALERRIESLMEDDTDLGVPETHWLGGGLVLMEPFPAVKAIIADARELGVI